jgi:hypothetical protein
MIMGRCVFGRGSLAGIEPSECCYLRIDLAGDPCFENSIDLEFLIMFNLAWWESNCTENTLKFGLVIA